MVAYGLDEYPIRATMTSLSRRAEEEMTLSGMIGVDVGGTFTDHVSIDEDGTITALKIPSNPTSMESSVLEGARALGVERKAAFNHASTAGLNAIITRQLPKIACLTTFGHRDILDMGRAWRPLEAQTDPHWRRSFGDAARPLVPRYLRRGVEERIKADGTVLLPLNEAQALEQLAVLKRCDVAGVAICFLNSYVNPEHERRVAELVSEVLGDVPCSMSADVSPLAKEYARASTTVVDVIMKIVFKEYADNLIGGLHALGFENQVNFADCAATLAPESFALRRPFRLVFSGPAAGTVSSSYFGDLSGEPNLVCCDVGGTSCDISVVTRGRPIVNTTFEIEHDLIVNTLANEIATLGAGGGSIVSIGANGELRVGPESAGGDPGPACYGKGGTLPTMTDACLLIGILSPEGFLGGKMKLDTDLAQEAFERLETNLDLRERVRHAYNLGLNHISEGILDITIRRAIDPRDYALMAYGSAGPMLLPAVLDEVGAKSLIVPPYPGLFSALGLLSTDLVYTDSRSAYVQLGLDAADRINGVFETMEEDLLRSTSTRREAVSIQRTFDGRLMGQTWDTPFVDAPNGRITGDAIEAMIVNFHTAYESRWGNRFESIPVEGVTYRVQLVLPTQKVNYPESDILEERRPDAVATSVLRFLEDDDVEAHEYERERLRSGDVIEGPAIIREPMSTTQVCKGQRAAVGRHGEIVITRSETEL